MDVHGVTDGAQQSLPVPVRCLFICLRSFCSYFERMSFMDFKAEKIANDPRLEPALEGQLRSVDLHEDIRRDQRQGAFHGTGLNGRRFQGDVQTHKREWAENAKAWKQARVTGKVKTACRRRQARTQGAGNFPHSRLNLFRTRVQGPTREAARRRAARALSMEAYTTEPWMPILSYT